MFKDELKKQMIVLKQKDIAAIKKVQVKLKSNTQRNWVFSNRVRGIKASMSRAVPHIADILRDYLDNSIGEFFMGQPFSQAIVLSVLQDEEFVALLIENNLIKRVVNLDYDSKGELKIRIYLAILNFDEYKKGSWCA